jgi:hypothetical protein
MQIAIVGRGRLGAALGESAQRAGHAVVLLRRPDASPARASAVPEAVIEPDMAWSRFDLVLLAFEMHAASVEDLARDATGSGLQRIPTSTPVASVVRSPSPDLLDALLPDHDILHFLTTPAARLPGAIALRPRTSADASRLEEALPELHWIEASETEYGRLAVLMIGSAMAAAALAHLARTLGVAGSEAEADVAYLGRVLDDAKRLLTLTDGDGFAAFSLVATPGGVTEKVHNAIFRAQWPLDDDEATPDG